MSGSNCLISDPDTAGTTIIVDTSSLNVVNFYYNHSPDDFTFTRSGNNLIIHAMSTDHQARAEIVDYFLRPSAFSFYYNINTDPTSSVTPAPLTLPDTVPVASAPPPSPQASSVTLLVGSEDNDILQGRDGADTLLGREGNDILRGGAGADTYVFGEENGEGEGADTIVEVAEEGVVNTLRFEGDYEVSDFSFARSSEDGTDLVLKADTDGDGQAENEITLDGYFVSETSLDTVYSIELQINDEEVFVPSVEG